jgi:glycerophosphoryl diester phosphodiesterase
MTSTYPHIIAHRCGGALAPENSLEGLRIAARLGCRGVEFDVMLSADGIPLLIHDETLERTTTGTGHVAELTARAIRQFDAGGPHHPAFAVAPAPTFSDAMTCCEELGLWTNIEIKPATGHESETGAIVGRWLADNWNGHGVVSSFSTLALTAAQQVASNLPCAMLVESLPANWQTQMHALHANAVHLAARFVTDKEAAALKEISWACYTVNQRPEGDRLFALGCHALFTDRPDLWTMGEM